MINLEGLTIDRESCLKGILAVLVVISHSSMGTQIQIGAHSFGSFNYFPVGCFFFLSGFGLEMQHLAGKPFSLLKKVIKLLLPLYCTYRLDDIFYNQ